MMSLLRQCRLSSKLQIQIGRNYATTSYHIFKTSTSSPFILRNSHVSRSSNSSILNNDKISFDIRCAQQITQRSNLSYYTKHHLPFRDCRRLDEAVKMMYDYLPNANDRNLSAFWSAVPRLLGSERNIEQMNHQLDHILDHTLEEIHSFGYRDLAQTALAFAKIVKSVGMRVPPSGTPHRLMYDRFIDINGRKKELIFNTVASRSMEILDQFDERHLSNLIYANGLVRHVMTEDGSEIFDVLAQQAAKLHNFNGQDLSNMLYAYAHAKVPNSTLFQEAGDSIVGLENLNEFKAQEVANIIWSFATLNEHHPRLFEMVADHILQLPGLGKFKPQELANLVWAYSTANVSNHQLFMRIADFIVTLNINNLDRFKPQELSNILLAYAKAGEEHPGIFEKVANHIVMGRLDKFNEQDCSNILWAFVNAEEHHPHLFKKVADHIIELNSLHDFKPQALSNTVWAYAKAGESHPQLFNILADEAIKRQHEFNPQDTTNFLWSYATNGQVDEHLLSSLVPSVKANLHQYTAQGLSNIAWAYAVVNVDAPSVFNDEFINACLKKENEFTVGELTQLHQWQLLQEELKSDISLPSSLKKRCYEAFISRVPRPSKLQDDVVSIISSMGLQPQEEVLLKSGYRIDAVVEVNGQVAVEVDGPSHFIGREMTGSTILKRRQVAALDGMKVVSVPYWEWDKLNEDGEKKQQYLQSLLDFETN